MRATKTILEMRFNAAQLHLLFRALTNAIEWQDSLADSLKPSRDDARWYQRAVAASLAYSNIREQIGRRLRGE